MKWLGIICIVLGFGLTAVTGLLSLVLHQIPQGQAVFLMILGLPTMYLGIAFLFIKRSAESRKKVSRILLIISVVLMLMGALSSFVLHIPGGRVELIFGSFMFNFSFVPLHTKARFEKWSVYVGSKSLARGLTTVDTVSLILCVQGLIFWIQHWPGAAALLGLGGLSLVINMLGWNRILGQQLVLRKQAEDKLEIAHSELHEKHEEIQDSIAYAKRIQSAILPPPKMINELLPNSFVLYKPKDVVAGDFYWLQTIDKKVLFAAADCTGHGVPGAMVSVICNSALNRSVLEYGLSEPGQILDKTREIVIKEFEKSEEEVKDGMDIGLCSLEGNLLRFAGAHNSLWIIRNGSSEVEQLKADKQPIGKYADETPFITHSTVLNSGDTIYLYSDGYADQFGGPKGKKMKAANFKKLLLSIQAQTMNEQKETIDRQFEDWKGKLEQLDDVCVIGVRV